MRLVQHFRIQPADHVASAAGPERIVGIEAELQMVRAEAGIDEIVFLRLGIERTLCAIGKALPEGRSEKARLSGLRKVAASHTRRMGAGIAA
jgi:hypothetical protein